MNTYATIKELKRETFRVKRRNIEEAIDIQVTFILENKHQKEHFFIKIRPILLQIMRPF